MAIKGAFNVPFTQMREYINAKKAVLPSETWQGIDFAAHSHAFAITGAVKLEFLHDVKKSIEDAANNGTGFAKWKKQFRAAVKGHGGDNEINTKPSGEVTATEAGNLHIPLLSKWRQRVIYETNMKSAYAAGKYARLTDEDGLTNFPYWQYVHGYYGKPNEPRDEHVKWDGMILPANHPWFDTHFPPNGWGCHCGIKPLTKKEAERTGRILETVPEEFDNNKGIGEGWAGNPGKANNPVNAVFDSAERFRKDEPKLYDDFLADYIKNMSEYNIKNNYAEGIEDVSQRILGIWNDKHYKNRQTENGNKNVALPVALLNEDRMKELDKEFRGGLLKLKETDAKNRGKIKIRNFTGNRIVTITEERFEHGVRVEKKHTTPPKDAYKKLSEVLQKGEIRFSTKYRRGKENVVITYNGISIAVDASGRIVTFYEKRT